MPTQPVRIDRDLFDDAGHTGAVMGRSAAGQIEHWARVGRAVESMPDLPHGLIARLLAKPAPSGPLTDSEHAAHLGALLSDAQSTTTAATFEPSEHENVLGADERGNVTERSLGRSTTDTFADIAALLTRAAPPTRVDKARAEAAAEQFRSLLDHMLATTVGVADLIKDMEIRHEDLHAILISNDWFRHDRAHAGT